MESMTMQQLDRDRWEVIVVDDGSLPSVQDNLCGLSLNFQWRYHYQRNAGPAAARNAGAAMARGEYLLFLDDDCQPAETWLEELQNHVKPGVLVGGRTVNKLKQNHFSEASQLLVSYLYEALASTRHYFFTSNNFAMDRHSFLKIGGFNTDFQTAAGEDRELCLRCYHLGYRLCHVPEAVVFHHHDLNFRSYLKQHFNYGRSGNTLRMVLKRLNIDLSLKQPHFFSRLLLYPLTNSRYSPAEKVTLPFLLGLSQVIYAVGYFYERYVVRGSGN